MDTAQAIFNPQSEDEHSPSLKEKKTCSEWGYEIKYREHQSKGKHLDICYNCYSEKKKSSKSKNREESKHRQKEKDNKESEDEDLESSNHSSNSEAKSSKKKNHKKMK